MRRFALLRTVVATVWGLTVQTSIAAISYVDATPSNTTCNGAPLVEGNNYTSGTGAGAMDNLWHRRTGFGNGGSVWSADELSGSEDVAPLAITVSFPGSGTYRLFAYTWNSTETGADWDAKVRLGNAGVYSRIQSSEAEPAAAGRFNSVVAVVDSSHQLIQIPLGVVSVPAGETAQVYIDDDASTELQRTWFDGVGYEKISDGIGERLIGIDFNKSNAPGAPSQSMFRSVRGSSSASQNSTNITKAVGPYSVSLTKSSTLQFDFRGANGDTTRTIPGGPTSLSFLVSDFIGTRDGTINIAISNLPSGRYLFRSYHLDTVQGSNFGYAQGTSSTTPNTLRAHVVGNLEGIIQPTVLGSLGLGTNFISDADIPTLAFPLEADGTNNLVINLSSVYTNGADRFILLNGFEIFSTNP